MQNFYNVAEGLDVKPLILQIKQNSSLWDQNTLRTRHSGTVHAEASDIWLRFNEIPENQESVINDKVCINYDPFTILSESQNIIFSLMARVKGESLGRCLITRLMPGKRIYPHADMGAPAEYYERYQIPLINDPGVLFRCGDEQVNMKPGSVWWFNNQIEHEVINNSKNERITMIVDIRSFR